jgi:tetratricopeptide (TPR) repeat protein
LKKGQRAARRRRKGEAIRFEAAGPFTDAMVEFAEGDATAARRRMEGVLRKARAEGDREGEVGALMNLVAIAGSRADHRRAREWAQRAIKALGEAGEPRLRAIVWFQRGLACLQSGEHRDAVASMEECVRLATQLGDRAMTGHALSLEGRARQKAGDWAGAADCYVRAAPQMRKGGPGREILGWLEELKAEMGQEKYYEALAASAARLGVIDPEG